MNGQDFLVLYIYVVYKADWFISFTVCSPLKKEKQQINAKHLTHTRWRMRPKKEYTISTNETPMSQGHPVFLIMGLQVFNLAWDSAPDQLLKTETRDSGELLLAQNENLQPLRTGHPSVNLCIHFSLRLLNFLFV